MPQRAVEPSEVDEILFDTFAKEFARHHESGRRTVVSRILVPTDFSPCSLHALRYAEELARRFGAELIMLYVDFALTIYDLPDQGEPSARPALERAVDLLREHDFAARGIAVHGVPADQIIRTAAAEHVDLIVMGTHGRSGVRHALMGSVAESVIRNAACPVMTVRAPSSGR